MTAPRFGLLLALVGVVLSAAADDAAELARIAAERQAAQTRLQLDADACRQRFAVNACVDDVRRRERDVLANLRDREIAIDAARRRQRAVDRRAAIAAKQRGAAPPAAASAAGRGGLSNPDALAGSAAGSGPAPSVATAAATATAAASAAPSLAASSTRSSDRGPKAVDAAQRVRAAERRRAESAAARHRVEQRLNDRAASGKAAAPLPVMPADAAASAAQR